MIGFAIREGWRNFRNISIIGLLTIGSLTLTLVLIGVSVCGYLVVESWRSGLQGRFEIEAFLATDVDKEIAFTIVDSIRSFELVSSVKYISQEDAAVRFANQFGEDLFELLGYNPLPSSLVIILDEEADLSKSWETVSRKVSEFGGVDEVVYDGEILAKVNRFYFRSGRIAGTGLIIMLLVSLTFTVLTVMGSIRMREQFIRVVAMSGGSRVIARGPFIVMGGYYGLVAGVAATCIVFCIQWLFTVAWGTDLLSTVWWIPILSGLGITIGVIGAGWAAGRYIKRF